MNKTISFLILASMLNTVALADDAIEGAPSSNIVFEMTPELIMQDETLTISKLASKTLGSEKFSIDVDFHFKNISQKNVTRKIAFVLPPVQCREDAASAWRGFAFDTKANLSFDQVSAFFNNKVDGKPQPYTVRTEAMLGERNITKLLIESNLPLNPCNVAMGSNGEPDKKYGDALAKNHLLTPTNDPAWRENIYFEWTQDFPAEKVVHIQHRYSPTAGEAVMAKRTASDIKQFLSGTDKPKEGIWSGDLASLDAGKEYCVMPMWVQYNLKTGAYWKGGIGHFTLILKDEAGAPFAINKFYSPADKIKMTKANHSLTFELNNFIPKENLRVLFLTLPYSAKEKSEMCGG